MKVGMNELELMRVLSDKPSSIEEARRQHHLPALLLGIGREKSEVAALCGTTVERIEQLLPDPTFQDLLAYYRDGGVYNRVKRSR
jgi:hypothetical protein